MTHIENLKISSKVMALLGLLGLFVLATALFTALKMQEIEDTYAALLTKDAKGTLELQHLNSRLLDTGRLVRMIMSERDPAQRRQFDTMLATNDDKLRVYAAAAKGLLPRQDADIGAVTKDIEVLIGIAQDIRAKAMTNDEFAIAKDAKERFEPAMSALRERLNALTAENYDALEAASAGAESDTRTTIKMTFAAIVAGLGAVLALALVLTRRYLSAPIIAMEEAMRNLAAKDYPSVEIGFHQRRDEVGVMARALLQFKEAMIQADQAAAEQEKGRLIREQRARQIEALTVSFDSAVSGILGNFARAGADMHSTASSMSDAAEETTRQAGNVAVAAEQASINVQTVASASEELASSIHEISRQVNQSAQVAASAAQQSSQTNELMIGLTRSAQRIGEVVKLIEEIAGQTNLLALNATIEAARAGDAGKGFAVVAGEVKLLANQTGKATGEIAEQVSAVQAATEEVVTAIKRIGVTIDEIHEISAAIASAVEEQGAATREIARNVQQAATGTDEVTRNIAGVSETATDTGHSAHGVLNAATGLARESEALRRLVDNFLKDVRAA